MVSIFLVGSIHSDNEISKLNYDLKMGGKKFCRLKIFTKQ